MNDRKIAAQKALDQLKELVATLDHEKVLAPEDVDQFDFLIAAVRIYVERD